MIENNQLVALIPARGGSKGLEKKNLKILNGKPLIDYTIQAALDSVYVDNVFLSSENTEILNYGKKREICLIERPHELALDTSTAVEVVSHFIKHQSLNSNTYIAYLQPTSPLRNSVILDNAISSMFKSGLHSLTSIVELESSPYKSFKINGQGTLESLFSEHLTNASRQMLPKTYLANGAIYIFRVQDFERLGGFPSNGGLPFIMSKEESVDIDTQNDFFEAERLLEVMNGRI